ncbi:hypothetical protein K474DRAFT_1667367 [Panus rudis PR-1116 ss-1]|nr:hypothetical protein K474DRAFT_1667367 [Panus rudis PR-1116 ss-1]
MSIPGPNFPLPQCAADSDIHKQVQHLQKDMQDISESFVEISNRLETIKRSRLNEEDREAVSRLSCEWGSFRDEYRKLTWNSRDLAGEARGEAEDFGLFLQILMKHLRNGHQTNAFMTSTSIIEALHCYKVEFESKGKTGQSFSDGFACLQERVDQFWTSWREIICRKDLYRKSKIQALDKDITRMRWKFGGLCAMIAAMGVAVVGAVVVWTVFMGNFQLDGGIVSAGLGSIPLAPLWSKWKGCREKLKALKKDKWAILSDEDDDSEQIIRSIASKLGGLANFWRTIVADIDSMEHELSSLSDDNGQAVYLLMEQRLQILLNTYDNLTSVFREYQTLPPIV